MLQIKLVFQLNTKKILYELYGDIAPIKMVLFETKVKSNTILNQINGQIFFLSFEKCPIWINMHVFFIHLQITPILIGILNTIVITEYFRSLLITLEIVELNILITLTLLFETISIIFTFSSKQNKIFRKKSNHKYLFQFFEFFIGRIVKI